MPVVSGRESMLVDQFRHSYKRVLALPQLTTLHSLADGQSRP
jgi:hypothetical protein